MDLMKRVQGLGSDKLLFNANHHLPFMRTRIMNCVLLFFCCIKQGAVESSLSEVTAHYVRITKADPPSVTIREHAAAEANPGHLMYILTLHLSVRLISASCRPTHSHPLIFCL